LIGAVYKFPYLLTSDGQISSIHFGPTVRRTTPVSEKKTGQSKDWICMFVWLTAVLGSCSQQGVSGRCVINSLHCHVVSSRSLLIL